MATYIQSTNQSLRFLGQFLGISWVSKPVGYLQVLFLDFGTGAPYPQLILRNPPIFTDETISFHYFSLVSSKDVYFYAFPSSKPCFLEVFMMINHRHGTLETFNLPTFETMQKMFQIFPHLINSLRFTLVRLFLSQA